MMDFDRVIEDIMVCHRQGTLDFLKWRHLPYYRDWKWLKESVAVKRYLYRVVIREGLAFLEKRSIPKARDNNNYDRRFYENQIYFSSVVNSIIYFLWE